MKRILFVCHGNICRSPMAEYIMKQLVREQGREQEFLIDSCAVSTEEIGNDIYPPAKRILTEKNIPFEKRKARQITREDFANFDYIVCMDEYNLRWLRNIARSYVCQPQYEKKISLMMQWAGEDREVADPWYTGNFEKTYNDLYRACQAMLLEVGS